MIALHLVTMSAAVAKAVQGTLPLPADQWIGMPCLDCRVRESPDLLATSRTGGPYRRALPADAKLGEHYSRA